MSGQPWETHDPLCPNRRPAIAFPNSACSGCRAVVAARAEGYARGLIEGDKGGRKEGERIGIQKALIAWKEAEPLHDAEVRALGQRDERESLPADSVAEGVRLLQTIGLDITYTDEGLAVIARQMLRMGQRDEREKGWATPETVEQANYWYERGQRDDREACIADIYRTCGHTKYEGCAPCAHDDAVAAIRARGEKP